MTPFRILYVGGSHPQRLAVRALSEAGFEVHVTDRGDAPDAAAHAAMAHRISATDADALTALAATLTRDGVPLAAYGIADYACASVARVNRVAGLPGQHPAALVAMIDKNATKDRLRRAGVAVPETLWYGAAAAFDPPAFRRRLAEFGPVPRVIVKPTNANASAGITAVAPDDDAGLRTAVTRAATHDSSVAVEEFLDGEIRNLDVLVADGEVVPVSMTRRVADKALDFLPVAQYQEPARDAAERVRRQDMAVAVADAFDRAEGPFTVDYIESARGPVVLEVSPHFHSIALELLRGNGNPQRAWFRYLRGDVDWRDDLSTLGEQAGALLMLRAHAVGRITGVRNERAMRDDPMVRDFIRLRADGTAVDDLSARGGLVVLAWLVGPSWQAIEDELTCGFGPVEVEVSGIRAEGAR